MLNYIWAGLIVSSLLFAIGYDVGDIRHDRYRNGEPLPVQLAFPDGYDAGARRVPVEIRIDAGQYGRFYDTDARPAGSYDGYLLQTQEGVQLRFDAGSSLPEPLATIAGVSKSRDDELQGELTGFTPPAPGAAASAGLLFERVEFVKMNAIAAAALSFAETAATIALGLIGVLALFLGLLKIAEEAGVIRALVKVVRPVLRPLFPCSGWAMRRRRSASRRWRSCRR
jgi:spore maturation protein A